MNDHPILLSSVFDGWDGYQTSLVRAIAPRSREELAYRPSPDMRSVGEIAGHISFGRIDWFNRMKAPGSEELARKVAALGQLGPLPPPGIIGSAAALVEWLDVSWKMVENVLNIWTVDDLAETYLQPYQGKVYAVSRQWTIWRIMAHDIHHGGQLTVMLGEQGLSLLELGDLGGHITEPPLAE